MCVCVNLHYIYINKPPGGSANHHHRDSNISAQDILNMQRLKWNTGKIIRDADCFSRISIPYIGPYLLTESLDSHMMESVRTMVK